MKIFSEEQKEIFVKLRFPEFKIFINDKILLNLLSFINENK